MLTQYRLLLEPDKPCCPRPEWGYPLYAELLSLAPPAFGELSHRQGISPLSQYLFSEREGLVWRVTLLGPDANAALDAVLAGKEEYALRRDRVRLRVRDCEHVRVEEPEELFSSSQGSTRHRLEFRTPACFKSRKEYRILPTTRLILQSLIQQWNVCFPDCPIEDENGEGTEAMADGLLCRHLQLHDEPYVIKKGEVTGFVGSLVLDNRLDGFHCQLADALLEFSSFAGIGIKTSLGMGGVLHRRIP